MHIPPVETWREAAQAAVQNAMDQIETLPTRTLGGHNPDLTRRQNAPATVTVVTGNDGNNNRDSGLSGGAIAGIVIGSIVGFLLLCWILKSLTNLGAPSEQVLESRRAQSGTAWYDDVAAERERPRRSRHRSHSSRGDRYYDRDYEGHRSPRRSSREVREIRRSSRDVAVAPPVYVYQGRHSRSRSRGY